MGKLSERINKFIEKQVRVDSIEDAENMGIKLPPDWKDKIKTTGKKKEPKISNRTPNKLPKNKKTKTPKMPAVPKDKKTNPFVSPKFSSGKATPIEEVAHQLTPKGPGYQAPEDIANDIRESKRLAHRIMRVKEPAHEEHNDT